MNMMPFSDEEQQWNGDELANVQLDQTWIPTAPGDEGSIDFGGQFLSEKAHQKEAATQIETPQKFPEDLKQLKF